MILSLFIYSLLKSVISLRSFLVGRPAPLSRCMFGIKNAESINGQPNEDVIYCGSGCVIYTRRDATAKVFIKLPSGLINTSDGTVPWSEYRSYDSAGVIVKGKTSAEFGAYAAALAVAVSKV